MRAAFFKGTKSGLSALFDICVHVWEAGQYAHVELLLTDGRSASATFLDGGVRFAPPGSIDFTDTTQWDIVDLPGFDEAAAINWFTKHDEDKYDLWGDARFVVGFIKQDSKAEFCSEAVGAALGFEESWRLDPNALYIVVKRFLTYQSKAA